MIYKDTFSGNGTQTTFQLSGQPIEPNLVQALVNDCAQIYGQNFLINTYFITFFPAPNLAENNIIVEYDGTPYE